MADVSPLNSISDDDELANVLAGVKNEAAAIDKSAPGSTTTVASLPPVPPSVPPAPNFDFEETQPVTSVTPIADITAPILSDPLTAPAAPTFTPPAASDPAPVTPAPSITTPVAASPELEALKKETLGELRPLVGKLELPAEEKFDTLLLIIRSTDDQSLLGPAHDAAKLITDETRRAAALLDIIKEIDYFSSKA